MEVHVALSFNTNPHENIPQIPFTWISTCNNWTNFIANCEKN